MPYSVRFCDALVYAAELHAEQRRKLSGEPYVAHLLAVAAMVMEHGGDEDEAIAALLHDAVEDQGGMATLEEIRRRFGLTVAAIVEGCSDSFVTPKPPWQQRKEAYVARLGGASGSVRLISAADKLHNARSIICGYRRDGEAIWESFRGGRDGTLWYYRAVAEVFRRAGESSLVDELERVVAELEGLTKQRQPTRRPSS
jgi:(p)ppGpp synthase/HD superfamily hydrolase